jgi:hypothetical protein
MKFAFSARRATYDAEKAILPCLIFCNVRHPAFRDDNEGLAGFTISAGWWDWAVSMTAIWPSDKRDEGNG